jgi:hypothetical protein
MGTEAFWVPAVMTALSAGTSYAATSSANQRQTNAENTAIQNQEEIRNKGNAEVNQTVNQVAAAPQNQAAIAAQEQGNYVAQLRRNAAGSSSGGSTSASPSLFGASTSALAPGVVGSSQYKSDAAKSQQQVQQYGNTEASEMGDLDAAVRERQNEGLDMQTLNTNLNTQGAQSYSQNFVDQLRAQTQGQTSPWAGLVSGLFGNAGQTLAKNPQLLGGASGVAPAGWSPTLPGDGSVPLNYQQQTDLGF